jgi:Reverse transcriptase (RNA-dependent DNA polymerase)
LQEYGIDYEETFAAVARTTMYRLLLALAAILDLRVHLFDIKPAFLYGKLDEEIYMQCPKGYETPG